MQEIERAKLIGFFDAHRGSYSLRYIEICTQINTSALRLLLQSQQMIMGNWLLQTGATLYSYWSANVTRIEEGFIADALLKFAESPYLGGQSGTGCGLCSMQFWFETADGDRGEFMQITPHAQKLSDRASESHARYKQYLEDYKGFLADSKSDIRSLLNG